MPRSPRKPSWQVAAHLLDTPAGDYVEVFQRLSAVNLEICSQGPSAPRLIQKAIREEAAGNPAAALAACLHAIALDPRSGEAHFQAANSYLQQALALPRGRRQERADRAAALVSEARRHLALALERNLDDLEAQELLEALREVPLNEGSPRPAPGRSSNP
ncbi:MAG: hypothetical protein ACYDBQ_05755 [Thermoplasmatota archaeon]